MEKQTSEKRREIDKVSPQHPRGSRATFLDALSPLSWSLEQANLELCYKAKKYTFKQF